MLQSGGVSCLRTCFLRQLPRYLLFLKIWGSCELDVCEPRCIPKKVRPFWPNIFIDEPPFFLAFDIMSLAFEMRTLLYYISTSFLRLIVLHTTPFMFDEFYTRT